MSFRTLFIFMISFMFFIYISSLRLGFIIPHEFTFTLMFMTLIMCSFKLFEDGNIIALRIIKFKGLDDLEYEYDSVIPC